MTELRKSGLGVLGDMPWGSHSCQFYETQRDLLDVLYALRRGLLPLDDRSSCARLARSR